MHWNSNFQIQFSAISYFLSMLTLRYLFLPICYWDILTAVIWFAFAYMSWPSTPTKYGITKATGGQGYGVKISRVIMSKTDMLTLALEVLFYGKCIVPLIITWTCSVSSVTLWPSIWY